MRKLKKAILLMVRTTTHHLNLPRPYYWSEYELSLLVNVYLLPGWYYHGLYHICLWIVRYKAFRRMAGWAIHTIPYHVRFKIA